MLNARYHDNANKQKSLFIVKISSIYKNSINEIFSLNIVKYGFITNKRRIVIGWIWWYVSFSAFLASAYYMYDVTGVSDWWRNGHMEKYDRSDHIFPCVRSAIGPNTPWRHTCRWVDARKCRERNVPSGPTYDYSSFISDKCISNNLVINGTDP